MSRIFNSSQYVRHIPWFGALVQSRSISSGVSGATLLDFLCCARRAAANAAKDPSTIKQATIAPTIIHASLDIFIFGPRTYPKKIFLLKPKLVVKDKTWPQQHPKTCLKKFSKILTTHFLLKNNALGEAPRSGIACAFEVSKRSP